MGYFKTTKFGNVQSVWVLYWADSQNKYNRNNYWKELEEFYQKYIISSGFKALTNFDYRQSNTNRRTREWEENKHWVEKYRGEKIKGVPLIIINGNVKLYVNSRSALSEVERFYEELSKRKEA